MILHLSENEEGYLEARRLIGHDPQIGQFTLLLRYRDLHLPTTSVRIEYLGRRFSDPDLCRSEHQKIVPFIKRIPSLSMFIGD